MGRIFCDRAFLECNGEEIADVETVDYSVKENLTRVETMTRNRRSAGFRKGNMGISLTCGLAIEIDKVALAVRLKSPGAVANLVVEMGGERLSFKDVEQAEQSGTASVGNAKKTLQLEAIDFVDENGRSRLSDFGLT